jgi:phenylacetate-coenzyme A ligase PaaK-like adenylate-forming protein
VFNEHGITPDDICSVDDLTKLPLTSKHDLLATKDDPNRSWDFVLLPPELREHLEVPSHERAKRFHALTEEKRNELDHLFWEYFPAHANHTTGRSAPPTAVWFTRRDLYDHAEKIRRCLAITKNDPLGKMLVLWPFTAISHQAFWCMPIFGLAVGAQIIHSGGGKAAGTDMLLQLVTIHRPQMLCIMPGYAFHFIRRAREADVRFENLQTV